ncbi:FtsW/RodA/SpoVE family cell cycle protein [Paenibacillus sp. y28]|uniref:FtsW/RodA/SpoVE family cell cycle protein n=1 Tax=Paenibacillus sp. y28 TaxID=3129110 RepID=UPI00301A9C73
MSRPEPQSARHILNEYMDVVCRQIGPREAHSSIRLELEDHLQDLAEAHRVQGMSETDAMREAIKQMGDPEQIGKQFHKLYKPRWDWAMLGLLFVLLTFGLIMMYGMQLALEPRLQQDLFLKKCLHTAGALALFIGFAFIDFQKLKKWGWQLYGGTVLMMLLLLLSGSQVNGKPYFMLPVIRIDISTLAPYTLLLGIAGLLTTPGFRKVKLHYRLLLFIFIPALLFIKANNLSSLVIYGVTLMIVLWFAKASTKEWLSFAAATVGCMVLLLPVLIWTGPYNLDRLTAFFYRFDDPQGSGYWTVQSMEALRSAGWWGRGFGIPLPTLPGIHTEMSFSYMVYSIGWAAGLLLIVGMLFLFQRLWQMAQAIPDSFGKLVVVTLAVLLAVPFLWAILMSAGLLPVSGMSIPFISYGGTFTLVQFAALGIVCSIYRQSGLMGLTVNRR